MHGSSAHVSPPRPLPLPLPCPAQLGDVEEAARCSFSHSFLAPEDPTTRANIPLYRRELALRNNQFMWRPEVPAVKESVRLYLEGEQVYVDQDWAGCVAAFEKSFRLQMEVCVWGRGGKGGGVAIVAALFGFQLEITV